MFLYLDESGTMGWPPTDRDPLFIVVVMSLADRRALVRARRMMRWTRARLERKLVSQQYLQRGEHLPYVKGSLIRNGGGRRLPGLTKFPELCTALFRKLAEEEARIKFFVLCYEKDPKERFRQYREKAPADDSVAPTRQQKKIASYMYRYGRVLSNVLASIKFPALSNAGRKYRVSRYKTRTRTQGLETSNLVTLVADRFTFDSRAASRSMRQSVTSALVKRGKLKGRYLQVWQNSVAKDECLQLVDTVANFFFQGAKVGATVTDGAVQLRDSGALHGTTAWTYETWKTAFEALSPKIAYCRCTSRLMPRKYARRRAKLT